VNDHGHTRPPDQELSLRLYVAGDSPRSVEARANLTSACRQHLGRLPVIEIVDLLEDPIRALADGILVTPLLIRLAPKPVVRIVGDLSDELVLLFALGVDRANR